MKTFLVAVAACAALMSTSPAGAQTRPVNEGNDDAACVTAAEVSAVVDAIYDGNVPLRRVRRIVDTPGRRVSPRATADIHTTVDADLGSGVSAKGTIVRAYRSCYTNDPAAALFVEYDAETPRQLAVFATSSNPNP